MYCFGMSELCLYIVFIGCGFVVVILFSDE